MNPSYSHVHLVGIGGINMSAVAKLLVHAGVKVSGSDAVASELTKDLEKKKIKVQIGSDAKFIPKETDLLIYSSAVPETNAERVEAKKRGIRELTNFQFLGEWTEQALTYLVTGTHGKSTTTAMLGLMMTKSEMPPTVIVGSKLKEFEEGNLFLGSTGSYVIEGDEYAKHFLEFKPTGVIINNIELDHTDVYPNLEAIMDTFRELLHRVRDKGVVVANVDDEHVADLIRQERAGLEERGVMIKTFGFSAHADMPIVDYAERPGEQRFAVEVSPQQIQRLMLHVPGKMNVLNACGALCLAHLTGVSGEVVRTVLNDFHGIWRRFEIIDERDGSLVVSDYGHHPTAVASTLQAARSFYPNKRLVLCFQPHHRNRTKHLFLEFVDSFDGADALILVEVYDVKGRDAEEDAEVSSRDLRDAVIRHDAERGVRRSVEFAESPEQALEMLRKQHQANDLMLVMGAGDVYQIAPKILN